MPPEMIPVSPNDPINMRLLSVAEDRIEGFRRLPFEAIAAASGVDAETIMLRLRAMLDAGVVRRIRQTLLATRLAQGALVAWKLPEECLDAAYCLLREHDPFTGHIVLRRAEGDAVGAEYRLWTTLKVPTGCGSLEEHCDMLARHIRAEHYVLLPARGVFALGVGHMRRRALKPGDRLPEPPRMQTTSKPKLSDDEWRVLLSLKEELAPSEIVPNPWAARAEKIGMSCEQYCRLAEKLDEKKVIGRFATFLEHVRTRSVDGPVTASNGLFHWTVPEGMEERAGAECGRHLCMTHCYWRTGAGSHFASAQIMGVVHGMSRETVLAHKAAIDAHLEQCGIPVLHTAVFWGERSEIRPSEISPTVYRAWRERIDEWPYL